MPPPVSLSAPSGTPLVFVLGPTASGKSRVAVDLAERIGAEIVGADSRQVYRGMDIGTGKVTEAERRSVPHHLIDVVDPDQPFGLADYCDMALPAVAEIRRRRNIPIVVGGSGQYIWALAEGWAVPRVAPDLGLREKLTARANAEGAESLHRELAGIDPEAAGAIHPHNVRRVIRALEVAAATGVAPFALRSRRTPLDSVLLLGLRVSRAELHQRIGRRVDAMFAGGFVAEVEELLRRGYAPSLPSMSGIGYTQVVQFLRGEMSLDGATTLIKAATHRLARQQSTWFRQTDERILWIEQEALSSTFERLTRVLVGGAGVPA